MSGQIQTFFINSTDLTNGSVELKHGINASKIRINRFEMYNTAYNIVNKSLNLTEYVLGVPTNTTSAIPDGFYTIDELLVVVSARLTTISPNGWTYNATLGNNSYKVTITNNQGVGTNNFKLSFIGDQYDLKERLGFSTDETLTLDSVTGDKIPVMSDHFYYLKSNLGGLLLNKTYFTYNTGFVENNILLRAVIDKPYGQMCFYENKQIEFYDMDIFNNLRTLTFELVDKGGQPVNLNGSPWSLELSYIKK